MLLLLEINFLHLILPVALLLAGWPPPLPRTHPFHRGEGGWCYDHDHGRGGGGGDPEPGTYMCSSTLICLIFFGGIPSLEVQKCEWTRWMPFVHLFHIQMPAIVWGKVVWSTVLTGAAWVVRDFSAVQGYEQSWNMMEKDHVFCFVDMESWLILHLMPETL